MQELGLNNRYSREGKVQFVCINNKYRNRNIYIVPIFDAGINEFAFYPKECKSYEPNIEELVKRYIPSVDTQVVIKHNQIFDKSNDKDYVTLMLLMVQEPTIVASQDEVVPGTTIGYIYDAEYEANQKVVKISRQYDLINKVHNLSIENQKRLAYYLGYDANKMSLPTMLATIYDKLENEPNTVANFFTDTDADVKTLINIMRKEGLITKRNNAFYFENIYLGVGISEVVNFLKQDANTDLFNSMRKVVRNPLAYVREEQRNETVSALSEPEQTSTQGRGRGSKK